MAASYNAGMGRISEEQSLQQVDESFELLLTSETSRYVFRILAVKQFLESPKTFGYQLKREHFYQTIPTHTILVNGAVDDWTSWAAKYGISYSQLKDFNLWLRDRKLVNASGKEYSIQLPDKADLKFNISEIKIHNPAWVEN